MLNKSKLNTRNPIRSMKIQHLKASNHKQNVSNINKINKNQRYEKNDKYEKQIKKQLKSRSSYISQSQQCNLKCFQNLSNYSIAQSKIFSSTASNNNYTMNNNYFTQIAYFNLQELNVLQDKQSVIKLVQKHQRTIQSRKALHKSLKIISLTNCFEYQQKTLQQQITQFQAKINQINVNFQHDTLTIQTEDKSFVQTKNMKNMNCFFGNQLNQDVKKMAHIASQMIDQLSELEGRKQTFANEGNIFDAYLSLIFNFPFYHMKCTASTASTASLLIEDKLQENKNRNQKYKTNERDYQQSAQTLQIKLIINQIKSIFYSLQKPQKMQLDSALNRNCPSLNYLTQLEGLLQETIKQNNSQDYQKYQERIEEVENFVNRWLRSGEICAPCRTYLQGYNILWKI